MAGTDAGSFAFDASTRQITTIAGVDYNHEAKASYSVMVTATDSNGDTATVEVTITVTDVDEQPARPDPPTVTPTAGAVGSLDVSWVKPDLNGGPDITGYQVRYESRPAGHSWGRAEDWPHSGTGTTTTITGLEPDPEYRVSVRAMNGETTSAWSEPSEVSKTNAAPTIVDQGVRVTSTPVLETETYGAGESIEVSVVFSEPVNATPETDFQLNVGGTKRAPLVRGSGTETLVFGYTVAPGDADDDGIWAGGQNSTLVGDRNGAPQPGTITSSATGESANLDHPELGVQGSHKVDGSRSILLVSVVVPCFEAPGALALTLAGLEGQDYPRALLGSRSARRR